MGVLNKGTDFSNGDQVTDTNLDNLVDNATFTSSAVDGSSTQISGAGAIIVRDGGITTSKLATGALNDAEVTATGSTAARSLSDRFAEAINVKDFGAVGDGVTNDTAAIQAAIDYCADNDKTLFAPAGTYYISSTIRVRCSLKGEEGTTFKKGSGSLMVHYGVYRTYENYTIDGNGEATGFDSHYDSSSTFAGGCKYSMASNILVKNVTERAFNLNQPLFGFTGINLRVLANNSDGSADDVIAFYTTVEDAEGTGGSISTTTNAAFSLITPSVYNRYTASNDVLFLHAQYCRGVSVTGAEVAAAQIINALQFDGYIQGAFEYIQKHSPVFNSVLEIGGGTNIQSFRLGTADWTADTDIPSTASAGRHIFRVDDDTVLNIPSISFFNNLGDTSGSAGVIGLVACQSGFTGKVNVGSVNEYDNGGGGFNQHVQVKNNNGDLVKLTKVGLFSSKAVLSRATVSGDSDKQLIVDRFNTFTKKYCSNKTQLREILVITEGDTTITDVDVKIATYDSSGTSVGSTTVIATIPSGAASGNVILTDDSNRYVPAGGYYQIAVSPLAATFGANTTFVAEVREDSII